jgi:large conductance mechanosensitive channel
MKKFFGEFKEFISKGNVLDMAVGVIIGGAFKAIVDSLVNDILTPIIGLLFDANFENLTAQIGNVTLTYGNFLSAILNFLIMALVLFLIVKSFNKVRSMSEKKEEAAPAAPTTKVCPFCKSEISIEATRCPHCTSELKD